MSNDGGIDHCTHAMSQTSYKIPNETARCRWQQLGWRADSFPTLYSTLFTRPAWKKISHTWHKTYSIWFSSKKMWWTCEKAQPNLIGIGTKFIYSVTNKGKIFTWFLVFFQWLFFSEFEIKSRNVLPVVSFKNFTEDVSFVVQMKSITFTEVVFCVCVQNENLLQLV